MDISESDKFWSHLLQTLNSRLNFTQIPHLLVNNSFVSTSLLFSVLTFLSIVLILKSSFYKRKLKNGYRSFSATLPSIQWIPFIKIPFLDGLIGFYKTRQEGVKMYEKAALQFGRDARIDLGTWRISAVSDPDIIKKLLGSTNPAHLNKCGFMYEQLFAPLMIDGLVAAKFDIWSVHRKTLSSAFTYKSFPTYLDFIINSAKSITEQSCLMADSETYRGTIDNSIVRDLLDRHAVKIATSIIMGLENCNFSDEQLAPFLENYKRMKEGAVERYLRPELLFPPVWWLSAVRKTFNSAVEEIAKFIYQITDMYRDRAFSSTKTGPLQNTDSVNGTGRSGEKGVENEKNMGIKSYECLMEMLIKSGFTNKEIADEVVTFLTAGHDTIKVALDFLIFHLSANPTHQKICRKEVDDLFNSKEATNNDECQFNLEDFSELKYLDRCISESMRITPPIPFFARDLNEPLEIKENYAIPAGETVLILVWILHRNEKIYPDPEKFDPNRFLPDNVKARHPYAYIPFSMGVRNCIGWKVAMLEIKVIMAWLLRHFEMTTTDTLNDVKIFFEITLRPERPFNVLFQRRKQKDNSEP